jgi:DNA-binding response OmpR family regulator
MKTQRNVRSVPGAPKGQHVKLLLVGRNDEFKGDWARRIYAGTRTWIAGRSASLLAALERLQSEAIDIVLLGDKFRDEELALFVTGARRDGFAGLILCLASMQPFGSDSSAASPPAGSTTKEALEDPLHPMRTTLGMRRPNEGWNDSISLSARQRAVLTRVSEGWTNRQVARHLRCTEGAVKGTLQQLFRKIGVRKRTQIVRMAFEKGLIDANGSERGRPYRVREIANPFVSPGGLQGKDPISVGHFVVDIAMHRVWVRGVETHLTPKEFGLLAVFVMRPGELVGSNTLCEIFWRNPTSKHDTLRVLVAALRAKIEVSKTPQYVVTERSLGYRFNPSPSSPGAGKNDTSLPGTRVR